MSDQNTPDTENGVIKDPAGWTTGEEPMTGRRTATLESRTPRLERGLPSPAQIVKRTVTKRGGVADYRRSGCTSSRTFPPDRMRRPRIVFHRGLLQMGLS